VGVLEASIVKKYNKLSKTTNLKRCLKKGEPPSKLK